MRHELSQFVARGSHSQDLYTTSRSGASEISPKFQQLRHERGHLKTETLRGQSTAGSLEEQVAYILRLPGIFEVEKQQSHTFTSRSSSLESRDFTDLSKFG